MHAYSISANFFLYKNRTRPKRLYDSVGFYYV